MAQHTRLQQWYMLFCLQHLSPIEPGSCSPSSPHHSPFGFPLYSSPSLAATTARSRCAHLAWSSIPSPHQAGTAAAPKWELARQLLLMIPLTALFHLLIQLSCSPPAWFPFPKHPGCSNPHSESSAPSSLHTKAMLMLFSLGRFPTPPAQQLLQLSSLDLK